MGSDVKASGASTGGNGINTSLGSGAIAVTSLGSGAPDVSSLPPGVTADSGPLGVSAGGPLGPVDGSGALSEAALARLDDSAMGSGPLSNAAVSAWLADSDLDSKPLSEADLARLPMVDPEHGSSALSAWLADPERGLEPLPTAAWTPLEPEPEPATQGVVVARPQGGVTLGGGPRTRRGFRLQARQEQGSRRREARFRARMDDMLAATTRIIARMERAEKRWRREEAARRREEAHRVQALFLARPTRILGG